MATKDLEIKALATETQRLVLQSEVILGELGTHHEELGSLLVSLKSEALTPVR